jgi:hypothetical protein
MTSPAKTYDMLVRPVVVAVRSETDPAKTYEVHLPWCPCPDYVNRRGNAFEDMCKHLRQAMAAVYGWHQGDAPEVHTDVTYGTAGKLLLAKGLDVNTARETLHRAALDGADSSALPDGGKADVTCKEGLFTVTIAGGVLTA